MMGKSAPRRFAALALALLASAGASVPAIAQPARRSARSVDAGTPSDQARPALLVADAFAGQPLLLAWDGPSTPRVLLPTGAAVPAVRSSYTLAPAPQGAPALRWLPPAELWEPAPATTPAPALAPARSLLRIGPALGEKGSHIFVDELRVRLRALPTSEQLLVLYPALRDQARGDHPLRPVVPALPIANEVRPLLDALARAPLDRWRVALLTTGLWLDQSAQPPSLSDETLELLARQQDQRLRVVLVAIWNADPALCEQVRTALATMPSVPRLSDANDAGPLALPAWNPDPQALGDLTDAVLEDWSNAPRVRRAARAWLDRQPTAAVRISDDAAALARPQDPQPSADSPTSPPQPLAAVTITNLTAQALTAGIDDALAPAFSPDLALVPPLASIELTAPPMSASGAGPMPTSAFPSPTRRLRVTLERDDTTQLDALARPLPAAPPGLVTGPFTPDLALAQFLAGATPRPTPDTLTAALLRRVRTSQGPRWMLFVECRVPTTPADAPTADEVTIWLGPAGGTRWRATLSPDAPSPNQPPPPADARTARMPDRWVGEVPLPSEFIPPDGVLLLALSRTVQTPQGTQRLSWPRAALPWDQRPSAAPIDLSAWDALTPADEQAPAPISTPTTTPSGPAAQP